ncbi:hypothetical protein O0L34_g11106 [Tuta absoluta]|nr:hypothetical protein O0L34_g11106 [Tuta absoluta]
MKDGKSSLLNGPARSLRERACQAANSNASRRTLVVFLTCMKDGKSSLLNGQVRNLRERACQAANSNASRRTFVVFLTCMKDGKSSLLNGPAASAPARQPIATPRDVHW